MRLLCLVFLLFTYFEQKKERIHFKVEWGLEPPVLSSSALALVPWKFIYVLPTCLSPPASFLPLYSIC